MPDCPLRFYPIIIKSRVASWARSNPIVTNRRSRYRVNLLEVAPDRLRNLRAVMGPERFETSHTILRSYWELADILLLAWPLVGMRRDLGAKHFVKEALGRISASLSWSCRRPST